MGTGNGSQPERRRYRFAIDKDQAPLQPKQRVKIKERLSNRTEKPKQKKSPREISKRIILWIYGIIEW
jgi:hypothetical protein